MFRYLKRFTLAAAVAPLLMLASADTADAQRRDRGDRDRGARRDRGTQNVSFQRRGRRGGRRGYWGNYWRWENNTYRPYWNRRYRYGYNRRFYGNRFGYGNRGVYGRGRVFNPYVGGSTFGLRLGNFGVRYRDWDWD